MFGVASTPWKVRPQAVTNTKTKTPANAGVLEISRRVQTSGGLGYLGLRDYVDVHALLSAALLELHPARDLREQRMVRAGADVRARAHGCTALPDQDISCQNGFAAEAFYAQPLGMRVAAVSGTAACFFMCHECKSC